MAECLRFYLWIATTAVLLKIRAVAPQCTANFKDELTVDGGIKGHETTIETRLIPSMRFTCNGTIVGFTITGAPSDAGPDDPIIQVWKEDKEQCGSYQKLDSEIAVHESSCSSITPQMNARIFQCVLNSELQVSVQYGDILGIELPPISNSDFELYFTDGGPTNYVFQRQLFSEIDTINSSDVVEEQPQITLDIISDQDFHCGIGHPVEMSPGPPRGISASAITLLIPDLKFTCDGIITQFTVGGRDRQGSKDPMIQVWRECTNQRGTYFKPVPDIVMNATVCNGGINVLSMGVIQCTLEEDFRVEVQAGDILGLELPPTDDQDFEVHFTNANGGPVNYVFRGQVLSSVELADREREVEDQPQINITLAPPATVISACERTSVCEISTTSISTTSSDSNNNNTKSRVATGVSVPAAVGGAIAGCVVVVIVITLLMLVIFTVWKRKQKWNITAANGATRTNEYPMTNPIYKENTLTSVTNNVGGDYDTPIDGTFDYEDIDEKEDIEADLKPKAALKAAGPGAALPPPPQPTKGNFYTKSPGPPATHQPSYSVVDDSGNYESPVPTLPRQGTTEGRPTEIKLNEPTAEGDYWEPADDVNELYQQLSANKYRDIKSSQIQITKALGSGQFGEVNKGIWQSPMGAMDVAVKQLQPGASEEEKVKFLKEAAINGQFRHPNVVKLMGVVSGEGSMTMIVLELLSNGDLLNFLINQRPRYHINYLSKDKLAAILSSHGETVRVGTQQMLLRFCQHVASGMSYLASKSFIHRDLAARNILVSEDKICKISDFGMSRDVEDENYYVSKGGKVPVKWTAPEALHYKKYSTASDVWSFGCVMYEIWSLGHKPFEFFSNTETVKKVDKGYILPPPPGLTKELYKIMIQCWKPESSRRPTFPQLVEMLSRADFELFAWEEEDVKDSDPQVKLIGAPLEAAQDLYPELQRLYTK